MKKIITSFICLLSFYMFGQDTTYFDNDWGKLESSKSASYYKVIQKDKNDDNKVKEMKYYISGKVMSETSYSNYTERTIDGKGKTYFQNGQLKEDIDYKDGQFHGTLLTFWDNGILKRKDLFENGKLVSGTCNDSDGKEIEHFDYHVAAKFPGGLSALYRHLAREIQYPEKSLMDEIQGRVMLKFIVNKDGSISGVEVLSGVNEEIDNEAIRVVKRLPKWEAAMRDGEPVRAYYNLPLSFRLD